MENIFESIDFKTKGFYIALLNKSFSTSDIIGRKYSNAQLYQLYLATLSGVDLKVLLNKSLQPDQMQSLREGLELGLDVSSFAQPEITANAMRAYIKILYLGVDIAPFLKRKETKGAYINEGVLNIYYDMLKLKLDITPFIDGNVGEDALKIFRTELLAGRKLDPFDFESASSQDIKYYAFRMKLRKYLKAPDFIKIENAAMLNKLITIAGSGYDVERFEKGEMTLTELFEDFENFVNQFDFFTEFYVKTKSDETKSFSTEQLSWLKKGYDKGFDIERYSSHDYSSFQMEAIYYALEDALPSYMLDVICNTKNSDVKMGELRLEYLDLVETKKQLESAKIIKYLTQYGSDYLTFKNNDMLLFKKEGGIINVYISSSVNGCVKTLVKKYPSKKAFFSTITPLLDFLLKEYPKLKGIKEGDIYELLEIFYTEN